MYCKYCGKELDGTETFCTGCGNPVNDRPGNAGMPARYNGGQRVYLAGSKKKFPLFGLITAVFIALIIVMALLILFPNGFKFHKKQEESVAAGTGSTSLGTQGSEEISDPAAETIAATGAETASTMRADPDLQEEEESREKAAAVEEHEFALEETSDTCLGGNAEIVLIDWDRKKSTITLRIYNNAREEISTFGFPMQVIDGQSIAMDPFSNMSLNLVHIASDSYMDLEYHVDPSLFEEGGRIEGELHIMNPAIIDRSYSLDVIIAGE